MQKKKGCLGTRCPSFFQGKYTNKYTNKVKKYLHFSKKYYILNNVLNTSTPKITYSAIAKR